MGDFECGCAKYKLRANWFRNNWCWFVRVALACIGLLVPLIMFLVPCENKPFIIISYRPLDVYIILDGSSSMGWDENDNDDPTLEAWNDAKLASSFMIEAFASVGFANLQVAALQFSNDGDQEVISSLTTDVDSVTDLITAQDLNGGGTFLAPALSVARTELINNGFDSSALPNTTTAQLVMIITDGENSDQGNSLTQSNLLKNEDVLIAGIMVRSDSIDNLFDLSSCDEFTVDAYLDCTYFTLESSFDNLKDKANDIALDLASGFSQSNTENRCVKAEWLIFLILLLPFALVCLFPYVKSLKKKEVRRISTYPVAKKVPPPPPPAAIVQVQPPKLPDMPEPKKKDPRFKWQIKAHDQYLWNLGGGGAAPLKVDFAGKAPPSAPKDPHGKKEKVAVETWEDEEGYICAEVEEPVTFEKYTEAKVAEVLDALGLKEMLKKFCCMCCCCCRVNSGNSDLPNAPVPSGEIQLRESGNRPSTLSLPTHPKITDTWTAYKPTPSKPKIQTSAIKPKPKVNRVQPKPRNVAPKPKIQTSAIKPKPKVNRVPPKPRNVAPKPRKNPPKPRVAPPRPR